MYSIEVQFSVGGREASVDRFIDAQHAGLRLQTYTVKAVQVVAPDGVSLLAPTSDDVLTLVTCYPFGRSPGSPLRYVVRAQPRSDARYATNQTQYSSPLD